jgi:hypothetical protein
MRSPWTQLYLHFTWATWDRYPFLAEVIAIGGSSITFTCWSGFRPRWRRRTSRSR